MKTKGLFIFNLIMAILVVIGDVLYLTIFRGELFCKSITSLLFFIMGLVNFVVLYKSYPKVFKKYAIFLTVGLFFAMLGDILLEIDFVIGAGLFAVGHIFYVVAFMLLEKFRIKDLVVLLILLAIFLPIILFVPAFDFEDMFVLVILYALVLLLMFAKALSNFLFNKKYSNKQISLILLGAFLFFVSDFALMLNLFANGGRPMSILCLTTYYPAEILLAASVWFVYYTKRFEIEKMSNIRKFYCRLYQICFRILLPILPYREPKILSSYESLCNVLKNNKKLNVCIVTDSGIVSYGLVNELKESLEKNEIKYSIFDEVVPNPTIECIEKAREFYLKNMCEAIIAIGGGSVMDCAKVMGARVVKPKMPVSKMKGLLKIRKRLPLLIAIPTTAGTGSETTLAAVITDEKTHHKYPINDFCLIPHFALLDSSITFGLPKSLTATTGMDALTHAVEAFIGKSTTFYTRKMAKNAVKLIVDNLHICYVNGVDFEARKSMLKAAFMAGNAFTRSYVGYVHAIAHSLGGKYGVAHGLANAVILPKMLRAYGKSVYKKLSYLAKISGLAQIEDSKKVASEKFIAYIEQMNKDMQIPDHIDAIKTEDIKDLAMLADKEANPLYPVPKLFSREELEQVYEIVKG